MSKFWTQSKPRQSRLKRSIPFIRIAYVYDSNVSGATPCRRESNVLNRCTPESQTTQQIAPKTETHRIEPPISVRTQRILFHIEFLFSLVLISLPPTPVSSRFMSNTLEVSGPLRAVYARIAALEATSTSAHHNSPSHAVSYLRSDKQKGRLWQHTIGIWIWCGCRWKNFA